MKIIDISWPISSEMTAYKDKHIVTFQQTKEFDQDGVRETIITLGSHTGTHIDAPAHFVRDGATLDELNLESYNGVARVIDMMHLDDRIEPQHLEALSITAGEILLFKTKNSALSVTAPFNPAFVYVSAQAAHYLVEKKIRAVGIDYLGIERMQPDHATHTAFMHAGIVIIEGLRLQHVVPGDYFLWCLPLKMPGLDGAPARAILIER